MISNKHTLNELCSVFSSHLGKTISYVRVPYDATKKALVKNGVPERQIEGLLEFYR
jgi:hypothetical protein